MLDKVTENAQLIYYDIFLLVQHQIAEVEGGATQGEVDQTTVKYHFVTTLGQASFVGVSGSGLLLGQGLLGRTCGFAIDNLHAVGKTQYSACPVYSHHKIY